MRFLFAEVVTGNTVSVLLVFVLFRALRFLFGRVAGICVVGRFILATGCDALAKGPTGAKADLEEARTPEDVFSLEDEFVTRFRLV